MVWVGWLVISPEGQLVGSLGFGGPRIRKAPCTHMVYSWALKGFPYSSLRAQVYTIWVHGPLGNKKGNVSGLFAAKCAALDLHHL